MKNKFKKLLALLLIVFGSYSFTTVLNEKIDINVDKSNLHWKGFKVTGSHEGNLRFESGTLTFTEDGKLVDGTFLIDMKSMECTDLEGEYKEKLDRHLKSKDFFGTNEHPSATLQFKEITVSGKNSYRIKGDLTIKGITNSIEFDFSIYGKKATATLKIDRTKYDIKYGSSSFFDGLKDKAIYDDFDIKVDLEF